MSRSNWAKDVADSERLVAVRRLLAEARATVLALEGEHSPVLRYLLDQAEEQAREAHARAHFGAYGALLV